MPVDQRHCRAVFQKLHRELGKITKRSDPDRVHKLRTNTRRVETVLEELVPQPDRNARKLLKSLGRLRKKAGRVRDLDVQAALVRNLKIARGAREKSQLLRVLDSERDKYEKKLAAALDKDTVRELRKRLTRSSKEIEIPDGLEPISVALQKFAELGREHSPITQKSLHQYRITGKRCRYVIEMAEKDPEASDVIERLEKMQDVVGDWHDWLTLSERAESLFGGVKDSALVAAMRNLTRAKFRQGVDIVMQTREALSGVKLGLQVAKSSRKRPGTARPVTAAAA